MKSVDAFKYFGGATKVAQLTGLTKQAVYQWPETVPMRWQYHLERLSAGVLKPSQPLPNYVLPQAETVE